MGESNLQANDFGKVAVLMGGASGEREISLRSGKAVLSAMQSMSLDAHGIDVDKNIFSVLDQQDFDRVFIALHGSGGEDGCIQGGLEIIGMPYTGSGVMASSICMDKLMTKRIWSAEGIPSPKFLAVSSDTAFSELEESLGLPFIVKPSLEGSSLGIHKVSTEADYQHALHESHKFKGQLLAEQWINGGEYTVAVLNDVALPIIKLETPRGFYDFEAKYQSNDTEYLIPSGLGTKTEQAIQAQALKAFQATGASGWGRVDVMLDQEGKAWFLEINTVPGMTDHSLVPMSAKHIGLTFENLVLEILNTSMLKK